MRHNLLHEFPCIVIYNFIVDEDFTDIVSQVIT